jgi:hypothetical protein
MSDMVDLMARAKSTSRPAKKTSFENKGGVTSDVIKYERGELQPANKEKVQRSTQTEPPRPDIRPAASSRVADGTAKGWLRSHGQFARLSRSLRGRWYLLRCW